MDLNVKIRELLTLPSHLTDIRHDSQQSFELKTDNNNNNNNNIDITSNVNIKDDKQSSFVKSITSDPIILRKCGCIISKSLLLQCQSKELQNCVVCDKPLDFQYWDLQPLKDIYNLVKTDEQPESLGIEDHESYRKKYEPVSRNQNLLSLFYKVANDLQTNSINSNLIQNNEKSSPVINKDEILEGEFDNNEFSDNASKTISSSRTSLITTTLIPTLQNNFQFKNNIQPSISNDFEINNEKLFVKNFPIYKRHYQYSTSPKKFPQLSKPKSYINNSISPKCEYFVVLSNSQFKVYKINGIQKPQLLFTGDKHLKTGKNSQDLQNHYENLLKFHSLQEIHEKLQNWEFLFCEITENFLIITGTNGILLIYSIKFEKPIYIYFSNFPIRCIAISQDSKLIAYGITGKDRINNSEQTLIVLHKLTLEESTSNEQNNDYNNDKNNDKNNNNDTNDQIDEILKIDPITITFPYKDPINKISFSKDSKYLTCSTAIESRFLIIMIKDPFNPKLVMKSIKSIDTSLESEGITDLQIFPNNRFMIISNVGFNSPSIIIDNNISTINGLQTVAQPKLVLKLNELSSNLHNCAISPRDDSIAIIDKNGSVYLITLNKINSMDFDYINNKRIFIIDQVSNSFSIKESASVKFDSNGYRLYILDRKGILYINDFIGGESNSENMIKSKVII
ncbi:hypothetical protein WICMUC_005874 [Wickerhamomyces mucosus]|uniref:SPS-sensor component PTR3 n=1 Tax=Wickerhamomyces mucosus TaxID=1378264 RepID=A0A9P8T3E9_9ASCO|nr:hypothetical protein WICMUC_005874 [Wickerhamomyces mucosus]